MSILDLFTGDTGKETRRGLLDVVGAGVGLAATGFNPLLGLLAAPAIAQDRERNRLENEAKRAELDAFKRREDAINRLPALLSQTTPQMVPGAPRRILPESPLGELGITSMPTHASVRDVPLLSTPQGQNEVLGALSQISPEGTATAIAQSMTRKPGALMQKAMDFQAITGRPPSVDEARAMAGATMTFEELQGYIMAAEAAYKDIAAMEAADSRTERLRKLEQTKRGTAAAVGFSYKGAKEALRLMESLRGTLLSPGGSSMLQSFARSGGGTIDAVAGAFGMDDKEARVVLNSYDRLSKKLAEMYPDVIAKFDVLGTITDSKFSVVQAAAPDLTTGIEANALLIADNLERMLSDADIAGVDIKERAEIQAFIADIRDQYSLSDAMRLLLKLRGQQDAN